MNFFKCETTVIFDEKHGYYKTVPKIALDYGEILRDFTYDTDPFSDYGIVILYKGVDWETISEGILDLYFKQYLDPVDYSDKEIEVIKKLYHMEPYKRKQLYETCEDLNEMATVELKKIIKPRYTSEKLDNGRKKGVYQPRVDKLGKRGVTKMSDKISFKTISDKYTLPEDEIETLCMFYDTNDFVNFKRQLSYLILLISETEKVDFIIDLLEYLKQVTDAKK